MLFSKLTILALSSLFIGAYSAPNVDISESADLLTAGIEARDIEVSAGEIQFVEREVELPEDFGVEPEDDDEEYDEDADEDDEEGGALEKRAASGAAIVKAAKKMAGKKYVWGGGGCKGPSKGGFDCSGLTQYAVCKATGNKKVIGRTTKLQYYGKGGKKLARKNAKPGDLIFWGKNCDRCSGGSCNGVYHVAIWLGKNKIFHASKPGVPVKEAKFYTYEVCSKVVRYW